MSEEKICPFCAETIKAAAVKCRHCGEMLNRETDWRTGSIAESQGRPSPFRPVEKPADQSHLILPGGIAALGLVIFTYAMTMDTTVSTAVGEVINLSLVNQQNNMRMAGGLISVVGLGWAAIVSQRK